MTKKIFTLGVAIALTATAATAQTPVKSSEVPKEVLSQYAAATSKAASKKADWVSTPTSYTADYDGQMTRLDLSGTVVWTSKKIDRSQIDPDIAAAYNSKYAAEYAFQGAEDATLANGDHRTFIIGRKAGVNYYFKYNDKKLMVEKTATCK